MIKVVFFFCFYFYYILSKVFIVFLRNRNKKKDSVLYLAAFFSENAGYHWRVHQWANILKKSGYHVSIKSTLSQNEFYKDINDNYYGFLLKQLHRRFWQVVNSRKYELVIVRRELLLFNDYGDLFLEKLLLKFHPNAILDFDDDISASKNQPKIIENFYAKIMLEHGDKFNESLRLYSYFIVPSNYLKSKILKQNNLISEPNILIIPTCVDYNKYEPKQYEMSKEVISFGWIGSNGNYKLLDILLPIFERLAKKYKFKLIVIGGTHFKSNRSFELEFIKWSLSDEIENLNKIDIGLMPLLYDDESKGKAGFKLIQYMGLGIVSIASPITINKEIVNHGVNSFLAKDEKEWEEIFIQILDRSIDIEKMSSSARESVLNRYTFISNSDKYLRFIDYVMKKSNLDL